MRFILSISFICITCSYQNLSLAQSANLFEVTDRNPLITNLPLPTEAKLLEKGNFKTSWSLNITNTTNEEILENEFLLIDSETYQFNIIAQYGISENWNLRLHIPYISHETGFLDQIIEDFHNTFGLPEGDRIKFPRQQIQYTYIKDGNTLLNFNEPASGIGDTSISLGYQFSKTSSSPVSLWTNIKIPTGDVEKLTGNDTTDYSIWLSSEFKTNEHITLYGNIGINKLGKGKILAEEQTNTVIFGSFGLNWKVKPKIALKVQLDGHSSFYDETDTRFLGHSLQITAGSSISLSEKLQLDIGIGEDIIAGASPDVNFHFNLIIHH